MMNTMTTIKTFLNQLLSQLNNNPCICSGKMKVNVETVNKNGIKREAIIVRSETTKGIAKAPIFYVDDLFDLYQRGYSVKEIEQHMANYFAESAEFPDFSELISKALKETIIPVMITKNGTEEFLEKIPHRDFLDLAVYYKLPITVDGNEGYITITNEMLKEFHVTEEYLYQTGVKRLPYTMETEARKIFNPGLTILTNFDLRFGSNLMLICEGFDMYCELYGENIYILPSSIHELYILPESIGKMRGITYLQEMVKHGNDMFCDEKDILSYSVYHYDRCKKKLSVCGSPSSFVVYTCSNSSKHKTAFS